MNSSTPSEPLHRSSCARVRACAFEYLDGELADDECTQILAHLDACPPCKSAVEGERRFLAALGRCCCIEAAPDELRSRINAALIAREEERRRK
jgi:mycothiol system anti-sigma-R factor